MAFINNNLGWVLNDRHFNQIYSNYLRNNLNECTVKTISLDNKEYIFCIKGAIK